MKPIWSNTWPASAYDVIDILRYCVTDIEMARANKAWSYEDGQRQETRY